MRMRNGLLVTLAAGCAALAAPAASGGAPPLCPSDCEAVPDGQVGITDFLAMLAQWGGPGACDVDGNGIVNITDFLLLLGEWGPCPPVLVPAGIDCWETSCGETKASFCLVPIPADFFEPGSEPFEGTVALQGATGFQDTQVRRLQDMLFDGVPAAQTVEIEIVQLSLVSCEPITVQTSGEPVEWDVEVGLSPDQPPPGQMTVTKEHQNGGVFHSDFLVQPVFIFTKVGDTSQVRVLDTGQAGFPPDHLISTGDNPWVHVLVPGSLIDPCGINFVPGVQQLDPGGPGPDQCCRPVCHSGATADHCVVVDQDCSRCLMGACCLPDGTCVMALHNSHCTNSLGGEYKGDGTTCFDSDGDGIPDVQENNDCCVPGTPCNTGTSPINPDTDGDGCIDGLDPEPCNENVGC